jgi:hypothetical protein
MNKLFLAFLVLSISLFAQTEQQMDSVNYYFNILLQRDRDSVNEYRSKNSLPLINKVFIEPNRDLYVKPDEHIDYCISKIHNSEEFFPHRGIYVENFHSLVSLDNITEYHQNPKKLAHYLFQRWKTSPKGHYLMMISDPNFWPNTPFEYVSFVVRYKFSYNPSKRIPWVMVATFTVFRENERVSTSNNKKRVR